MRGHCQWGKVLLLLLVWPQGASCWNSQPPIPVLAVTTFANADLLKRLIKSIDYPIENIIII